MSLSMLIVKTLGYFKVSIALLIALQLFIVHTANVYMALWENQGADISKLQGLQVTFYIFCLKSKQKCLI